eukprot:CAMPEP_0170406838 /NCGR_PEP_ID=MMETSP0117_2-20130122/27934_1 /TAXON_ID=400756 /ORGANISM="Durinskia baltica, Strain CSIRO CS-38" /LENGTH=58 /DNA_ID=CAMNT_0010664059 /DNA_START=72 /DNA_END=244 /DNA_ORIENTATION=+
MGARLESAAQPRATPFLSPRARSPVRGVGPSDVVSLLGHTRSGAEDAARRNPNVRVCT